MNELIKTEELANELISGKDVGDFTNNELKDIAKYLSKEAEKTSNSLKQSNLKLQELENHLLSQEEAVKIAKEETAKATQLKDGEFDGVVQKIFNKPKEDLKKSIAISGIIASIISVCILLISLYFGSEQSKKQEKKIAQQIIEISKNIENSISKLNEIQKNAEIQNKEIKQKLKTFSHSLVIVASSSIKADMIRILERKQKKYKELHNEFPDINIKEIEYLNNNKRYSLIIGIGESYFEAKKIKKKAKKFGFKDILIKKIIN